MANLYELMNEYESLQLALEDPEADREAILNALDEAKGDLRTKVDNVCRVIANVKGNAVKFKAEEQRLGARRKTMENDEQRLKNWLRDTMRVLDVQKIKTDLHSVTVSDGQDTVVVTNEAIVPDAFIRVKREVDRQAVMKAYKDDGEIAPGCDIVAGTPVLRIR